MFMYTAWYIIIHPARPGLGQIHACMCMCTYMHVCVCMRVCEQRVSGGLQLSFQKGPRGGTGVIKNKLNALSFAMDTTIN